ncbi:response regulator [Comamonas endophytica]|uniref:histidine kinase n=1 Tax=Comamonas endophytica TaxID=2949090 RepID=A0ABY6GGA1_9BURK|nr:response regulator [Acidovorax sp. 5MLIR]UYG53509.1 response regulator [Acidovorax sp. 5MLIR]
MRDPNNLCISTEGITVDDQGALERIFVGDSDMARHMRAHDWTSTSLGDPLQWPQPLKLAVRILLTSKFEMWIGWGPDIAFLYNDAYRPTLGSKHEYALGMPIRELYAEIWPDIEPRLRRVYEDGEATWDRALMLILHRHGYPEETYHTFSYSPLVGDMDAVEGIFCAVSEETERVISVRRLETLESLASALATTDSFDVFYQAIANEARKANKSIPFSALYKFDADGKALPIYEDLGGIADIERWKLDAACKSPQPLIVDIDPSENLPKGGWDIGPKQAAVLCMNAAGSEYPVGAFVVGLNPYRPFDDDYQSFLKLFVGQIAARWTTIEGFETARLRTQALNEALALRQEAADNLAKVNESLSREVLLRTAQRDRLHAMFKQAPSFMALLSGPEHVFELANDAYQSLIGTRDIIGRSVREVLPDVTGQGYFEILDNVYKTGEAFKGEAMSIRLNRGDKTEQRFLHLIYQPIFIDGKVEGIFVDGYDVTHQKNAEDALRQINVTLEAHVKERTAELELALERLRQEAEERSLAERALQRAQKMEALGALTGGVAHDFNNSLQVISANLQILGLMLKANPEALKRVNGAMGGVTRGAKLASQLLSFGRRQPLEPKVVNVGKFIRGLEDMLNRALGESIELEIVISAGLWNTMADPSQVENAVLNLAINARDAMDGRGKLTIEAGNALLDFQYCEQHEDLKPGQYVVIAVTDTGTGMAPEVLERAFEPFFSTKPEGKGTGLGLSMVYGFVKQSGGHAAVYSEVGEGTTVKLYLPRSNQEEDPAPINWSSGPVQGGTETVLVVEDDEDVRETAVATLVGLGYRVLRAKDADSALTVVDSGVHIDVLFTDVMMPGKLRSRELARRAKQRLPSLAVLFTSGYTENSIVHGGRLDEGVELLSKPYTREALARRIRHVIGNEAQRRQAIEDIVQSADDAAPARLKLLVVENDELIRTATAEQLRLSGHEVSEAADAKEAFTALGMQAGFDALVLDIGLPDMNGVELAHRALALHPHLGIVFASGASPSPELGVPSTARYVVKPYSTAQLLAECAMAIRLRQATRSAL